MIAKSKFKKLLLPLLTIKTGGAFAFSDLNRYVFNKTFGEKNSLESLDAALGWIKTASALNQDKGISAEYNLLKNWSGPYPETTGYIINTLLTLYRVRNDHELLAWAKRLGDWELDIQREDGAILSNLVGTNVRVFNTGQVMLGLIDIYETTLEKKYLEASIKAAKFLVTTQESDGSWIQNTYCGARTYHSRVSWALLKLYNITKDESYLTAARKNTGWVVAQFKSNGWIASCGFNSDKPITHVLDYSIRGLLEIALISKELDQEFGLMKTIECSLEHFVAALKNQHVRGIDHLCPQAFDEDWKGDVRSSCLTGNAQFAYTLLRFNDVKKNSSFEEAANKLLKTLGIFQNIQTDYAPVRGAIPGCFPYDIGYHNFGFPNWATKFYLDALIKKMFDQNVEG